MTDNIAETFSGGRYTVVTLERDTILYRAGTADKPLGQFFSSEPPAGVIQTRIDKAVLPEWPGGAKSPLDAMFEIKIPAGTKVYVGEVGSQGGFYVGGSQQIVVERKRGQIYFHRTPGVDWKIKLPPFATVKCSRLTQRRRLS